MNTSPPELSAEFAAEAGDWAMHCHMSHHVMTQMGHGLPSMIGVDTKVLDQRMARVDPRYMSMGQGGMGGMGEMGMPNPAEQRCHEEQPWPVRADRHGRHVHRREGA